MPSAMHQQRETSTKAPKHVMQLSLLTRRSASAISSRDDRRVKTTMQQQATQQRSRLPDSLFFFAYSQQRTINMMSKSLITTTLQQELPLPVKFVLDNDDNDSNEPAVVRLSQTTSTSSNNNNSGHHFQHRHVRFDEHVELHELPPLTQQEHDLYWYKERDYLAMQREAGIILPAMAKRQRTSNLRTACWIERSLWLGTVVCGILVTESLHHAADGRRDR